MTAPALPLRCVLLYSGGHLGSSIVFNVLQHAPEIEIVGVVRAEPAARFWKMMKQLNKVGWQFAWLLAWQRLIQFMIFYGIAPLIKRNHMLTAWQLADRMGIPSYRAKHINHEPALHFIRTLQPDLLISAYFSQILKKPVLEIPRIGALNVHPGFLPDYKGAMNYFWVLKNGEDRAGVSVHWMDEGVDTGALLARRRFLLSPNATQQQVLARTAIIGARLLQRVLHVIATGATPATIERQEQEGRYYPLPGAAEFRDYFKHRRFFRIRDVFALVIRKGGAHA